VPTEAEMERNIELALKHPSWQDLGRNAWAETTRRSSQRFRSSAGPVSSHGPERRAAAPVRAAPAGLLEDPPTTTHPNLNL